MKALFIECKMGVAGDMLMSALFELLNSKQQNQFLEIMNNILPDILRIEYLQASKSGIYGTKLKVLINNQEEDNIHKHEHCHEYEHNHEHEHCHEHSHSHEHYSFLSLRDKIRELPINDTVKAMAINVYSVIANAEAKVHNTDIEHIHFHEVGSLDALADVVGNCILFDMLDIDQVICSPIHVGNGTVKCAHGILPVPAPATLEILKGIPFYSGNIMSELCTPTGAAIIKNFADSFGNMPEMLIDKTGIGVGTKDFEIANIVRVFLGELQANDTSNTSDTIIELSCNIDDMTGEELGFALEVLMRKGALDVFYIPIQMKKNRPGILLKVFCEQSDKEKFRDLIFKHTSTRGIRYIEFNRYKLEANYEKKTSKYGPIQLKTNTGYGIQKEKFEFEDLRKIALENDISLAEVKKEL